MRPAALRTLAPSWLRASGSHNVTTYQAPSRCLRKRCNLTRDRTLPHTIWHWHTIGTTILKRPSTSSPLFKITSGPKTPDLLYLKGKVLEGISGTTTSARGDARAESAAALSRACRLRPQEEACTDAALAMIHQESFGDAATLIEQTLPHLSPSVRLLSALGLARFRIGRYNDAIDAYSKAIEIDPTLEAPREGLGFLLYMTGNLERARSVVEEGIRSSPSGFYLPYLRALILYRQSPGLRSEALAAASASIEKNPAFAPAYFLRGKIRADQNDPVAALGDFQAAVRIDPKYPSLLPDGPDLYPQMGRSAKQRKRPENSRSSAVCERMRF